MAIPDFQEIKNTALENKFISLLLALFIIGVVIAFLVGKADILPTFFVSLISLSVVYGTAQDSKNKLRLELFEKRYEIYEDLIKFASNALMYGNINEDAEKAAHESFRGLKYHKSQFLFGDDIKDYFYELNKSYSHLVSHKTINNKSEQQIEKWYEHLEKVQDIVKNAPELFKPYLYFGDIKGGKIE